MAQNYSIDDILTGSVNSGRERNISRFNELKDTRKAIAEAKRGPLGSALGDFGNRVMDARVTADIPYNDNDWTVRDLATLGMEMAPVSGDAVAIDDARRAWGEGKKGLAALYAASTAPVAGPVVLGGSKLAMGAMPFLAGAIVPNSKLGQRGAQRTTQPITQLEPDILTGRRVSTTSPTPAQAEKTGFHESDDRIITLDAMRANPDKFAHNMDLVSQYMPLRSKTPEGRAQEAIEHLSGNLDYLVKNSPDTFIKRSGNWYKGANALANDLTDAYEIPIEASAGVLARLSPGMDWFQNVEQADRLVNIWKYQRGTPLPDEAFRRMQELNPKVDVSRLKGSKLEDLRSSTDKARWIRAFDEAFYPRNFMGITPEGALTEIQRSKAGQPKSFMWQSNDNLSRAIEMLEDPQPANISRLLGRGHKIRNFYNDISDPLHPDDVTIDTHAVSAAVLTPYSQQGVPVGHAFGGGAIPGVVQGSAQSGEAKGTYGLFADAYRQAAQDTGVIPQALQSPTWELVRENFPYSGAQKEALRQRVDPIWDAVKRQQISPDEARAMIEDIVTSGQGFATPEWHSGR